MKKNLKVIAIVMLVLGVFTLTGCSLGFNKKSENNNENIENQNDKYVAIFNSEDNGYVEIYKEGDSYKANISLFRIARFEDCAVENIKDEVATISGTDPRNYPIKFSFDFNTKKLTVIESTWGLLKEGTSFEFEE